MSRSPTISTARGTKREMQQRLSGLRGQFGPKGVEATLFREGRGRWRLNFWLTLERERIRQVNLKLKGKKPEEGPELPDSARAILAAIFTGAELLPFQWAGKPAWRLSTKHRRERAEDVVLLKHFRLIRFFGDSYILTAAGTREVLRRLGGNP